MISLQQHRKLMNKHEMTGSVTAAAIAAGVDRKTARRYIEGAPGPGEVQPRRSWRTHADAFAPVWAQIEQWLAREPELTAKAMFAELCRRHPERFQAGQLRSLQRRVAAWKRRHGPEPLIIFRQEHRPGERWQLDWFDATELGIKIAGEAFAHKLCHVVLPFSNWEWASVCRSESFASLRRGFQCAAWELGRVPLWSQTDQSSTATHPRGKGQRGREWNVRYLSLLAHYGMRPDKTAIATPEQNGDVESAHHHLKVAMRDALGLRGRSEFASVEDYEGFVAEVARERNRSRAGKVEEELAVMQPLPPTRLPEWEELNVQVGRESIARIGKHGYSVPARYIGQFLRARVYEHGVELWEGTTRVLAAPHLAHSSKGVRVDWRHVLPQLLLRPGAFARWRHRDSLFPSAQWRAAYDTLTVRHSQGRAEREYLGLLQLALEHGVEVVEPLLGADVALDTARACLAPRTINAVPPTVDLSIYDALLEVAHG